MRKTYPLNQFQVEVLNAVKLDLEIAQKTFATATAMAMAAAGIAPPCNFAGLQDGGMIVETPDPAP